MAIAALAVVGLVRASRLGGRDARGPSRTVPVSVLNLVGG
jgi:hypothetical protein